MKFGAAFELLEDGQRVSRRAWKCVGIWVALKKPAAHGRYAQPCLPLRGALVPWVARTDDLLADDWIAVS